jgi:peroxidase
LDLANLTAAFARKRLSRTDLVALSGILSNSSISSELRCFFTCQLIKLSYSLFIQARTPSGCRSAPTSGPGSTTRPTSARRSRRCVGPAAPRRPATATYGNLAPLDAATPTAFDNAYYYTRAWWRGAG